MNVKKTIDHNLYQKRKTTFCIKTCAKTSKNFMRSFSLEIFNKMQ
ncbi:hypothetical protein LEP1GSC186_2742 [Leptospira noguchii serovar Autumnalis str. ZUN142]|uniref:Uncharacterized protein n=1 Tax=Leptospira noguchii serovar Autumnalis str. ZUN142 TaxID=1085540 RepID=M6U2N8_9LEPT|nr:hypothetical protein LEP1GSC186_2742 [Leptospira noguchii serovar Autumnalis str. ZUN142]